MTRMSVIVPATDAPATLDACLAAIAAAGVADEIVVVRAAEGPGPAWARNRGVADAAGDLLVFVDADVVVHADALARIRDRFAADASLAALFGAYDDAPADPGLVSAFRNLLHHHVHAGAGGDATTFWTGLGAVRREAFAGVGGFDPHPRLHYIEDIDLGVRLGDAGRRIVLDPSVRGTHLKRWTLGGMVRTDLRHRGVPWVRLMLRRRRASGALNLGTRHRVSAVASVALVAAVVARRPAAGAAALAVILVANRDLYALLARRLGARGAAAGVALHVLHHLVAVAAVPLGIAQHLAEGRR